MYNLRRHLESCLMNILQILTYKWDPLQIKNKPNAEEEYEDYAGAICNMLVLQKSLAAIIEYLWEVETQVLGLDGNFTHTEEIAKKLFALAESEYKYSTLERARDQGLTKPEKGDCSSRRHTNSRKEIHWNLQEPQVQDAICKTEQAKQL